MEKLVSVCICCFNAASTVGKSIESVLTQTFQEFELLVIDDGSTDNSAAVIEQYGVKDKRIRILHQVNKGIGFSRNRAIEEAKSDWVTFLDADDVWHSQKLALQMRYALSSPEPDAITCAEFIFERESQLDQFFSLDASQPIQSKPLENLAVQLLTKNFNFPPASVIWNVEKLRIYGLYGYDRNGEDFQPFLRLAINNGRLIHLEYPLYGVRNREGSLSRSSSNHYQGAVARVNAIERIQQESDNGVLFLAEETSRLLQEAKRRFICWAMYGARRDISRRQRIVLSKPLFKKLDSRSLRTLERLKLVYSICFKK